MITTLEFYNDFKVVWKIQLLKKATNKEDDYRERKGDKVKKIKRGKFSLKCVYWQIKVHFLKYP